MYKTFTDLCLTKLKKATYIKKSIKKKIINLFQESI